MKELKLIDTHCDTAFELYHRGSSILKNKCNISISRAEIYNNYTQFFAIWTAKRLRDQDGYKAFIDISDNLSKEIDENKDRIALVKNFNEMQKAWDENKIAAFLAVEDARILAGDINRMDELKARGVKYLTLMWGKTSCIGGSHDVEGGLSPFGHDVVRKCFDYGIVPDISHSNEQTTDDVCRLAYEYNRPFIASHSNCYSVYPHSRNLRDKHLKAIIELGGIVGFSLCPYHLKDMSNGICTIDDVVRHIDKYMELGAENVLGFGCDLDGTDLPDGFEGVNDLEKIADALLKRGYSEETVEKIFYKNYYDFILKNFN